MERNLRRVSFAVANMTGFVARLRRGVGPSLKSEGAHLEQPYEPSCDSAFVRHTVGERAFHRGCNGRCKQPISGGPAAPVVLIRPMGRPLGFHWRPEGRVSQRGRGTAEFLQSDANREVWVIDTTVEPARTYHVSLDKMTDKLVSVRSQWASTAQLSYQDGSALYIAGGYGQDGHGNGSNSQ